MRTNLLDKIKRLYPVKLFFLSDSLAYPSIHNFKCAEIRKLWQEF